MSVFTKIINGELPCYKIAENENFIAFLDIEPLAIGHVLIVPKIEVDKIFDLPVNYLAEMLVFAQPIAKSIEKSFDCKRCGLSVIGIEVPHTHMHLLPINNANDLNFTRPKLDPSEKEMENALQKILANL